MDGSRLQILNLLQRSGHATIDQMSRELSLASATVRRHLDILQRDHLVAYTHVKKKTGRPEYTYHLTEVGQELLPKDYGSLLSRLLQEMTTLSPADLGDRSGGELLQFLFQRVASRTAAKATSTTDEPFPQRVTRALAVLQDEKFDPEATEHEGSVRFVLHNCPFRSVARGNDSVCDYDRQVLTTILGVDLVQEHCINKNDSACCYRIAVPGTAA